MNVRLTPTSVMPMHPAPTQMEDTLVLATLGSLAMDKIAQVPNTYRNL